MSEAMQSEAMSSEMSAMMRADDAFTGGFDSTRRKKQKA